MSTNTAFNIYVRQVVRNRSIPFTIEAPSKDDVMAKGRAAFYRMRQAAAEAGMQDMALDEINEEISPNTSVRSISTSPIGSSRPVHNMAFCYPSYLPSSCG